MLLMALFSVWSASCNVESLPSMLRTTAVIFPLPPLLSSLFRITHRCFVGFVEANPVFQAETIHRPLFLWQSRQPKARVALLRGQLRLPAPGAVRFVHRLGRFCRIHPRTPYCKVRENSEQLTPLWRVTDTGYPYIWGQQAIFYKFLGSFQARELLNFIDQLFIAL